MRHEPNRISSIARAAALGLVVLTAACSGAGGANVTGAPESQTPAPSASSPANASTPAKASRAPTAPPTPGAPANASATPPSTGITEAQAIAAVQAFAPHATGLRVTETDTVPMGRSYRVQSADIVAEVDEATGQVRMFVDNAAMPQSGVVRLTKDDGLVSATAWLAAHGITTAGLTPTTTLLDHGSTKEFEVDFQGRVNGARVPHRVTVSIDPATGTVYAFVLFTRPFATPPAPRLTVAQAGAAATAEEKDPGAKVTATDLAIAFDAAGTQILVYEVDLTRTDGFFVKLQVDAETGAVTVLGRG